MKKNINLRLPASEILPAVVLMSGADMQTAELTTRRGAVCRLPDVPLRRIFPMHAGGVLLAVLASFMRSPNNQSVYIPLPKYARMMGLSPLPADMPEFADDVDAAITALTLGRFSWNDEDESRKEGIQLFEDGGEYSGDLCAVISDRFADFCRGCDSMAIPSALIATHAISLIAVGLAMGIFELRPQIWGVTRWADVFRQLGDSTRDAEGRRLQWQALYTIEDFCKEPAILDSWRKMKGAAAIDEYMITELAARLLTEAEKYFKR